MEDAKQPQARPNRLGVVAGVASLVASLASLFTFLRNGGCHEELRQILVAGERPPEWLTWELVDPWKTASVVLACVALSLAILASVRRAQPVATIALARGEIPLSDY